jgi:hypothetical protein
LAVIEQGDSLTYYGRVALNEEFLKIVGDWQQVPKRTNNTVGFGGTGFSLCGLDFA